MNIVLKRIYPEHVEGTPSLNANPSTLNHISGSLHIDGHSICDTEENPRTALPEGTYRIVRHHCKQYNRYMPIVICHPEQSEGSEDINLRCTHCQLSLEEEEEVTLNTVMPCICPMLKPGNGVHHREDGSILLGTRIVPGCLSHPLDAFNPLSERIRKAIFRGKEITLVIQRNTSTHQHLNTSTINDTPHAKHQQNHPPL